MSRLIQSPSYLLLILLLGYPQLSETIYSPSLPDIARSLGTSVNRVEFTLGIYFIGFALGVLCWGIMADRFGRKLSMLLGLLIYTLSSLGCRQSTTLETLLFFRLIQGWGASSGSVVTQTIIRDCFTGKERSRFFSVVGAALAVVPAFGPLLGGTMDHYWGWQSDFTFLCELGIFLFIFSGSRLYETKAHSEVTLTFHTIKTTGLRMIQDPQLLAYIFIIGACNGIIFSYYSESPFLFSQVFGYTTEEYSRFGISIAVSSFIGSVLSHRLNGRFTPERVVMTGSLLSGLGAFLLGLNTYFHEASSILQSSIYFLSSICVIFLGIGLMIPNCLAVALSKYTEAIGTAGSLFGFSYYVLVSLFTYGMGTFHDGTLVAITTYFGTLCALISLACIWINLGGTFRVFLR